jgi:ribosomal protein S18 acetylase RimI-like enzyme
MLYEAASWRPGSRESIEDVLADERVARYITGWGRPGDRAVVFEERPNRPVGAAWYRLFPRTAPGYGFVAEGIPELTVAVVVKRRGEGIGTQLLEALIKRAREDGFSSLSLSVERANPAAALYRRLGFVETGIEADAVTMLLRL